MSNGDDRASAAIFDDDDHGPEDYSDLLAGSSNGSGIGSGSRSTYNSRTLDILKQLFFNGSHVSPRDHLPELLPSPCEDLVCEDTEGFRTLYRFVYPLLLALCVVGNTLNIAVYSESRLRTSSTVRLLTAKAVANTGYLICLLTNFIKVIDRAGGRGEELFWLTNPAVMFLVNMFGSCATWLTTVLTVDTFLCVVRPTRFKEICTLRFANRCITSFLTLSFVLHLFYPLTRVVERVSCPDNATTVYRIFQRNSMGLLQQQLERIYYWLNILIVIVLPFIVMAVLSFSVLQRINCRDRGRFTKLKKCILRITFSTTLTHLLLECPQMALFLAAAISGSSDRGSVALFNCSTMLCTNFLSMTNAAVPFVLYIASSRKFRHVLSLRLWRLLAATAAAASARSKAAARSNESEQLCCHHLSTAFGAAGGNGYNMSDAKLSSTTCRLAHAGVPPPVMVAELKCYVNATTLRPLTPPPPMSPRRIVY